MSCTQLSTGSTMIYSSAYSTAIDWTIRIDGLSDLGGAISLKFVKDGASSCTNLHSNWEFI